MRIHLTAAVYVLFFSPFLGVTRSEYGVLLLTIAMVIAAEAFNTAMEMLITRRKAIIRSSAKQKISRRERCLCAPFLPLLSV